MEVGEYKEPREEGRVVIQPSLAMKVEELNQWSFEVNNRGTLKDLKSFAIKGISIHVSRFFHQIIEGSLLNTQGVMGSRLKS
ncbi:unnamed protein product [Brassica oleracea]